MYSLRYALALGRDNTKRLADLAYFCERAKIDDINFFINHEEIGRGHLTFDETREWLELSAELKEFLAARDITFSMNPGITLMHGDRGRVLNGTLGFETMVDATGLKATAVACPFDPNFQAYLAKTYAMYAEVEPDYLWLEDDLRHFNHKPVQWGCFCEKHMAEYRQRLGNDSITREELVRAILKPGKPTIERLAYLEIAKQTMIDLVSKIEQAVHGVSPKTKLSLMTSQPDQHTTEGRDWDRIFKALSGNQPFVARPHLPSYNEVTPKEYSKGFNSISRVTADLLKDEAELFPELENYMYSRYAKSNHFSKFQLMTSLMLHPKGTTMNLFDMMGTGVVHEYHLQEMLAEVKPYLSQVNALDLKVSEQKGIHVLYAPKASYVVETKEGLKREELIAHDDSWLELLSSFGFSVIPAQFDFSIKNQFVAVSGQYLRTLSDEEVIHLYQENFILMDGESASILVEKELGHLVGIQGLEWKEVRSGKQSYEQVTNGRSYCGVEEARMTLMQKTGDFADITYDEQDLTVISRAFNEYDKEEGIVCAGSKNSFILPLAWDEKDGWNSQYISFKEEMIREVLLEQETAQRLVVSTIDMPYVNMFHYVKAGRSYYIIANFSSENYNQITCKLDETTAKLKEYHLTGEKEIQFQNQVIATPLAALDIKVFEVL